MRRSAAPAVAGILALTACGGSGGEGDAPAPAPKAESSGPDPSVQRAAVGEPLTLRGQQDGERMAMTVKNWADPATGAGEYDKPKDGKRWVAAQFELRNTGKALYDEIPSGGAEAIDEQGQRFGARIAEVTAGPAMPGSVKVPAEEKALGWIVFEVPADSKIVTVQFALGSGYAHQAGWWAVK
ncbi:DUF4352 domain-containing protein [Streptomyces sp. WM6372]|uniref:DUF4352 domain-containing protein n=1 Tax=Streptomyces sp. WM6372 TaxID=1415555 RepID=UPI000B042AF5|nr:DUF4352 domain-containing protein [Streptomyces sp. WM6372]